MLNTVSPELKKLLIDNPSAPKLLTNLLAEAFPNRTVRLYYFYSNNESEPRAFHYFPNAIGVADVVICVQENQSPLDQFICLLFEILNSTGESRFATLLNEAKAGNISRTEFAKGMVIIEFDATKKTREMLLKLRFNGKAAAESHYYGRFIECPTDFDAFIVYQKKARSRRNPIEEYEVKYDSLRKMYQNSNPSTNSANQKN